MGQLLPQTGHTSQRGYGYQEANGGYAEFHEYAGRYASYARHAHCAWRTECGAADARNGGHTPRITTNDAADDFARDGSNADQPRNDDANDDWSRRSVWKPPSRPRPKFWWRAELRTAESNPGVWVWRRRREGRPRRSAMVILRSGRSGI